MNLSVPDFSKATDRVFTGARLDTEAEIDYLVSIGVTHVINTRVSFNDMTLIKGRNLAYLWIPTEDDKERKSWEWFDKALRFAMPVLSIPKPIVLAHCEAGVNRGPSIAYAILRAQGLSREQAEGVIRTARPQVNIAYRDDADRALTQLGWTT